MLGCLKRPIDLEVQLSKMGEKMELVWQELKIQEKAEICLKAKAIDQDQEIAQLKATIAEQRKDITLLQEQNEKLLQEQKQMALILEQQTERPFKLQQSKKLHVDEEIGQVFTGLSPDLLCLMPKLMNTTGIVFYPEEGKVRVIGTTEEEREKYITRFQTTYQNILQNMKLRTEDIAVPQNIPPYEVASVIATTNEKYDQCHFEFSFDADKSSIHVVSTSSRQFDQAKKIIADKLHTHVHVHGKPSSPSPLGDCQVIMTFSDRHGKRTLTVKKADICKEEVDIIVNAANSSLSHGAGVALALDRASNGELTQHSMKQIDQHGKVYVGDVALTKGGGQLKCKFVIHAVCPTATPITSDTLCEELLYSAVTRALSVAQSLSGCKSIAFPAISTGVFGVNCDLAAKTIINAILSFNYSSSKLSDLRIVIIDQPTYSCFAEHLIVKKALGEDATKGASGKGPGNNTSTGAKGSSFGSGKGHAYGNNKSKGNGGKGSAGDNVGDGGAPYGRSQSHGSISSSHSDNDDDWN